MPKQLEGYVVDVLELLEGLGPVQARAMFGGCGEGRDFAPGQGAATRAQEMRCS